MHKTNTSSWLKTLSAIISQRGPLTFPNSTKTQYHGPEATAAVLPGERLTEGRMLMRKIIKKILKYSGSEDVLKKYNNNITRIL